ncbi:MAG: response regulator [Archangium sp.]|nr:response regulator [Archangium sp.]
MKLAEGLPLEVLDLFRDEAKEHLDGLVQGLEKLAQAPDALAGAIVHELARRLHTIKGGAAGIGFEPIARVAHEAENVLISDAPVAERVRKVARATAWIDGAVRDQHEDPTAILEELRKAALSAPHPSAPPPTASAPPPASAPPANAAGRESIRVRVRTVESLVAPLAALAGERAESRFRRERLRRSAESARGLWRRANAAPLGPAELEELSALVAGLEREAAAARESARTMTRSVSAAEETLQKMRLVSVASLEEPLRLSSMDAAARTGKEVQFSLVGGGVFVDRRVLDELRGPLVHLVRNAVDHGLETAAERARLGKQGPGRLVVRVVSLGDLVEVSVEDNGRGIDAAKVGQRAVALGQLAPEAAAKLQPAELFAVLATPGFSTREQVTELSGRGTGMDVVAGAVRGLGGQVSLHTELGQGTTFQLSIPVAALSTRVLFVRLRGETLALPLSGVDGTARLGPEAFYEVGGRRFVTLGGAGVPVHELEQGQAAAAPEGKRTAVRVRAAGGPLALLVDEIVGEEEVSVRPLGPPLRHIEGVIGSTLAESGEVVLVLDPRGLGRLGAFANEDLAAAPARPARVLVVDDSITTRTLERHILERAGYQVELARDGVEALAALRANRFDLVVSDYEMPNLDGIGLVRAMRADEGLEALPLILVTSVVGEETRRRALAAGANAYVMKGQFDQDTLLAAIAEHLAGRRG